MALIEYQNALNTILDKISLLGIQEVSLQQVPQRICSHTLLADIDIPPFDTSAMDGYAVRHSDILDVPVELEIIEHIKAGYIPQKTVCANQCSAIMTGAPLPSGADTVIMVEHTSKLNKSLVRINKSATHSANIRFCGEVFTNTSPIIHKGDVFTKQHIPLLAASGKTSIPVFSLPTVIIVSTGDELVEPNITPKPGKIRNTNAPMLIAYLNAMNIVPDYTGIALDTKVDLTQKIQNGLQSDILILTGGVSSGDFDLVPSVLHELGVKKVFHKVNIKPGKPFFFGKRDNTLVFGVPGNPISSMIIFILFIRPAILKMMGAKNISTPVLYGRLTRDFHKRQGRKTFYPVKIEFIDSSYSITPLKYLGSADIRAFTEADGIMILDGAKTEFKYNTMVEFMWIC